jgi:hypothetical protein
VKTKDILEIISSGIVPVIAAIIVSRLRARPKIRYWFPHEFLFNLPPDNVLLKTYSLTVQNMGRETAEDVEIIYSKRPDFLSLHPSLPFVEETTPSGEHVLRIKSLGKQEHFFLQMLNYTSPAPTLLNVRSKAGAGKGISVHLQQVAPRWLRGIVICLMFIGVWVIFYWLYKGIVVAGKAAGWW